MVNTLFRRGKKITLLLHRLPKEESYKGSERKEKYCIYNDFYNIFDILQITPLKFGSDWILHPEILKFGFYPLKFSDVWISHSNVS